jgi:hypothetical protein
MQIVIDIPEDVLKRTVFYCIFQCGIVRNHCDFYEAESEGEQ